MGGEVARKDKPVRRTETVPHWWPIIEDRFDQLADDFKKERDRAEQHRQRMVDGLSLLERTTAALNNTVAALTERVEKVEPDVNDYREKRAERRGAAKLMGRVLRVGLPLLAIAATIGAAVIGVYFHRGL